MTALHSRVKTGERVSLEVVDLTACVNRVIPDLLATPTLTSVHLIRVNLAVPV